MKYRYIKCKIRTQIHETDPRCSKRGFPVGGFGPRSFGRTPVFNILAILNATTEIHREKAMVGSWKLYNSVVWHEIMRSY